MLKSFSSAATFAVYSLESTRVIGPTPDTPAKAFFHVDSTSLPSGVKAPNPVTTTRFLSINLCTPLFYRPHRIAIAPQVNPPPKPTITITSPS